MTRTLVQITKMVSRNTSSFSNYVQYSKKIIGAGLNYTALLQTSTAIKPKNPIVFLKPSSSYIQEGENIIIPKGFKVNEEIELGVIIGKKCTKVCEKDVLDYVAGYCVALDLTATSELTVARQLGLPWSIGKGFDTACPVSSFIPKEDICDPNNLDLWVRVNGDMRQEGNTSDMIFSVQKLISFISQTMTLEPNDLILTGTPPGMSSIVAGDTIKGGIKDLVTISFNVRDEC